MPEPEPREVRYTIISVDDHLSEPAHMFEGRLPKHLQDRAPKIVRTPEAAAAEIRRNAERGVVTVSLPERPHLLGYPSVFSGYWDPVVEACVETDTVISLHVGSSGQAPLLPEERTLALGATLFGQMSLAACAEWLWSGYAVRYREVKIAMAEGGIGWVPMLIDRLENI